MLLQIVYIVIGVVLVLWGADRLTDGAVGIATRLNIPQIVIGLTIVAMGTSMPEFCVSLVSALKGTADLAVGNVVGSNVFNALLIVGVTALVAPMTILRQTVRKDIPFALVASMLLVLMCLDGTLSRIDALVLLALFGFFMYVTLQAGLSAKKADKQAASDEPAEAQAPMSWLRASLFIIIGLGCLIGGSNLFVGGATAVATELGISDAVVGLTVVAMGTSLPELATSVVAARKGNSGIAIGNALGSNVFNILLILGLTGAITPLTLQGITTLDLTMLVVSMMLLWLFSFTKLTIERWEGALLTTIFVAYMTYLVMAAV
ncbi:MAG: calcium/sodium antiporter [Prevotella sp.]|nr:calcium/sodium antiporter [Prevotella sp.]MBQ2338620.1 calcium/sodium antiporter [Prevotella sp.]